MADISAELVRQLREKTGAGMMDCKKALTETAGNFEAAIDFLRKKGLASAAKKAGRIASEGLAWVTSIDGGLKVSAIEVNCETDFVGKNDDFIGLVSDLGTMACKSEATTVESLSNATYQPVKFKQSGTVKEVLTGLVAKIGENMTIRRVKTYHAKAGEVLGSYTHGHGRVAVIVKSKAKNQSSGTSGEGAQILKDICMHIAALKPEFLDPSQVTPERMEREKDIYLQQAMESGKPREIAEKIVQGKMQKFYGEMCLLKQPFVKNPDVTVEKLIQDFNKKNNESFQLVDFVRFGLGEGIEKKVENFAEEVAAMQKNRS